MKKHVQRTITAASRSPLVDLSIPASDCVENILKNASGNWVIDKRFGRLIARCIHEYDCRDILEYGAGTSSRVFACALSESSGAGRVTSIEQDPTWCEEAWSCVKSCPGIDAAMIVSTPGFRLHRLGIVAMYDKQIHRLSERAPFDMIVIDAPQHWFGREGVLLQAFKYLKINGVVLVDDAAREGEMIMIHKWLKIFPGLQILHYSAQGKGYAVIRKNSDAVRFDAASFLHGVKAGVARMRRINNHNGVC